MKPAFGICILAALSGVALLLSASTDGSAAKAAASGDPAKLQRLPGSHGPKSDPALEAALQHLDPSRDGWESEAFAEAATAQLAKLGDLIASGPTSRSGAAGDLAARDSSFGPLRPADLREVYRDANTSVTRPARQPDASSAPSSAQRGPEGLLRSVQGLTAPMEGSHGRVRAEFQVFGVELQSASATASILFHASGPARQGVVEQSAVWRTQWARPADGAPPLLRSITVEQYEEVTSRAPRMFSDLTMAVLGGNESFNRQLLPGVDYWLSRLESWIESDGFGHQGLAVGDVNGDGLDDLYVCQIGGLPNLLFIQNPDGTATDVSASSGVDWLERTRSALLVDLDNDGDQDLVAATSVSLLFMSNDGTGRFSPRATLTVPQGEAAAGKAPATVEGGHYSRAGDIGGARTSDLVMLAAADYDNDGYLDVYACAYHASSEEADRFPIPIPYHDANNGGPNIMLRNDGKWGFTDVTRQVGLDTNNRRFSFAAAWEDYDNDGDPDLFVANDFGRKNLYRNDAGRFTDVAPAAGVEDVGAGMSASWGDYDNDGWMDLYVGNMFSAAGSRLASQPTFQSRAAGPTRAQYMRHARGNSLFRNVGDGTFRDVSVEAGVTMGRWAWDSRFVDLDNSGGEDILVSNGYFTRDDSQDLNSYFWRRVVALSPPEVVDPASVPAYAEAWRSLGRLIRRGKSLNGNERRCVFLNIGQPRFATVSATSGLDMIEDGRAAATVDWDLDGDLDLWLANRTGPRLRFARNEIGSAQRFLQVRLEGVRTNKDAIGARLELQLEGGGRRFQTLRAGDGYLSQSSKWIHFGLGAEGRPAVLKIRWPGGDVEEIEGLRAGSRYRIVQGSGRAEPWSAATRDLKLAPAALPEPPDPDRGRIFLSAPVPAPTLSYTTLDGQTPATAPAGGPMLVILWTTDCAACAEDLASIARRAEDLKAAGLSALALAADGLDGRARPDPAAVRAALDRARYPFEAGLADAVLLGKLDLLQAKVITLPRPLPAPTSFLVDGDGLLAAIYKGPLSIDQLLADMPALRTAGERRLKVAIPFPGRRQTRGWPSFFDYMDGVAQAYADGGYPDEAVAYYRKLVRIKPGRVESHFSLGATLAGLGRPEEAIAEYREVLKIDPKHVAALNNLGFELSRLGDVEQAIDRYREALAIDADNVPTLNNLGAALLAQGKLDESIESNRKALRLQPDNAPALNNLALALARQGNNAEAIVQYRRALELDEGNAVARINLALALSRQGEAKEAEGHLRQAAKDHPEYAEARYHLGLALLRGGDLSGAVAELTEAARLKPDFSMAHYQLSLALARQGDTQAASRHLSLAMRLEPGSLAAEEKLAWILATHNDPAVRDGAQAVRLAQKVCEATGNQQFTALDTLAAAYAEAGRFTEAVDTAKRAADLARARGEQDSANRIRGRIELYEAGRPFRDSP